MAAQSPTAGTRPSGHDLELAALAGAGDRAAYGELVRRHSASVRGLLRRMGAEPSLADDVAQDAFLAGFEQVAAFRGSGTFRAWIGQIAARQFVRRRRRDGRLTALADVEDAAGGGESGAAQRIDLDEALKTLSEPERLCVSMCYGAGLSHQEVAELLNTPLGTVKSHVKRGLDKLRSRLSPDGAPATERKLHG
jgi:RNA polymerase sigma factor (sigma-70 family)